MKTLIISHAHCTDGFTSAWVCRKALGEADVDFKFCKHGGEIPDTSEYKRVIIADFSFPPETILKIAEGAKVTLLDHHVSAQSFLEGVAHDNLNITFDMQRCGAMLAWDHFFPEEEAPALVKYVQDMDLWNWELDSSVEVCTAIELEDKTFESWDLLSARIENDFGSIVEAGKMALAYKQSLINIIVEGHYMAEVDGHLVPVVNSSVLQSEVGSALAKGHPFSVVWNYRPSGMVSNSLRSDKDDDSAIDVSKIAEAFGGGGHRSAAGCCTETPFLPIEEVES